VRGSTRLEIGWTLAPVLVLAALAGYTIDHIPAVKDAPSDAIVVNVLAQQWSFSYVYGQNSGVSGKAPSGGALVVPENTAVKLEVKSKDVDHDWWVPALRPEDRRHPRSDELHLVQGHPHGHVPRPVRRVLRHRPRHDGDHREGGLAVRLERLHRPS